MKKLIIVFLAFAVSKTYSQNEFAASSFYDDFKKIYADAQAGFALYKGDEQKNQFKELTTEYRVNLLLPLADSGKIIIPVSGNPYVVYYFEPGKTKQEVNLRAVNLREAIITAFGKPLYSRTETSIVEQYFFSNSYYFTSRNETQSVSAVFKSSIYHFNGKYHLSFEIRGKSQ